MDVSTGVDEGFDSDTPRCTDSAIRRPQYGYTEPPPPSGHGFGNARVMRLEGGEATS